MLFSWQIVKALFGVQKHETLQEPAFSYTGLVDIVVQGFPAESSPFDRQLFVAEASILLAKLDLACEQAGKFRAFCSLVDGFYSASEAAEDDADKLLALLEDLIFAAAVLCGKETEFWHASWPMFDRWRSYLQPPTE